MLVYPVTLAIVPESRPNRKEPITSCLPTAQRDFAKRFERGKLSFTGDVLQVISVFGRPKKFGKLLKRFTVGA
jgi:hypothetical protein